MVTNEFQFDWSDLAFASKKPLRELHATFIAAPRDISPARFTQLVKDYLSKSNIVLGLAKEAYIDGFENQPQFKTLQFKTVQRVIDKVNASPSKHKIYTLMYFQRELPYILEKLKFEMNVFVNGSWKYPFHTQTPFYTVVESGLHYKLVAAFSSEQEAKAYEQSIVLSALPTGGKYTELEMMHFAAEAAKHSFDNGFQTGVSLGRKKGNAYELLSTAYNRVVPYQTYALLHGAAREINFSPTHDLNHYDTTHAEVELLLNAQRSKLDLQGMTLFINLLPCPTCARMLARTNIAEVVYTEDHSDGYAVGMLEQAGKTVRRLV